MKVKPDLNFVSKVLLQRFSEPAELYQTTKTSLRTPRTSLRLITDPYCTLDSPQLQLKPLNGFKEHLKGMQGNTH